MRRLELLAVFLLIFGAIARAEGQGSSRQPALPPMTDQGLPQATPSRPGSGDNPADSIPERARDEQANLRNNERQRKLADDTAKLLALATELKEQVDKTNKNILSVDVIKKADEIEKLAKSVKERMRGSGI